MFSIGPFAVRSRVLLAPMAGVTDLPFRQICRHYGVGLATSEMVTSDTRLWQSDKSRLRLTYSAELAPVSVQIAGSEPDMMAQAAIECVKLGAQIVDINMGCPAKKVCKKLAGSALLQDEKRVAEILTAVVSAVDVPVTLKTRTGWSPENRNGVTIARMAEDIGIAALTVHGRTRECRFKGQAEYDTLADIVQNVSIPVIANGDIDSTDKAKYVLDYTGAQAVMVGRAALGNPWLLQSIAHTLEGGNTESVEKKAPSWIELNEVITAHLRELHKFYGEYQGVRIARKHLSWYAQTLASLGAGNFDTRHFNALETPQTQFEALRAYFEGPNSYEEKAA
ncbi:tRNA dihydrouridine synthase DusB [Saccharophagus degradans]|uniref:tRNA-dihydrouridine synthase B n=1 Tax=Saccharophagus degradans TaxID=86304 RepID=A0AAW7X6G2_9GAMM|nr:tRNA dihydrouridine synthase DusB [Saccharophagus degradans]MDO6423164.1 tRNA dihydrouridine synthase DusB [Saccharophagus degradans]MDO6607312.1 tRNA dihydrouridine synthase DusB [Saccharophagus degradans]